MMWFIMEKTQDKHRLSDRLIRAITNWQLNDMDDDILALIKAGADVNRRHGTLLPLHCACMVGDSEILKLLLRKGARVNDKDGYERNALHYAAEKDEECVRILLENGANIDEGDGNGDTALHWAAYKKKVECVTFLLRNGANVNSTDYNMNTPISWAARKGNLDVIKVLLDFNADVDIRSFNGHTALQRSTGINASGLNNENDDATLELLIKASGQFDFLDDNGEMLRVLGRDNRLNEILRPLYENPRPLLQLCRHQIRKSLSCRFLPDAIPTLPVPPKLQEFLLLLDQTDLLGARHPRREHIAGNI